MEYPVVDPVATGRNIRRLRVLKRLKVEDVARFMGFESVQAVYKWQRGESLPTVDNLVALSVLLGTAMDDIIITREEAGEMPASVFSAFIGENRLAYFRRTMRDTPFFMRYG